MSREREITESYERRAPVLVALAHRLETATRDALHGIPHIDRIAFRAKQRDSFVAKALSTEKEYEHPLVEIEDQVAGRVLVFFVDDIDFVVTALRRRFNEVESRKKEPKDDAAFGYESHHLVCMIPPDCEPKGWAGIDDPPKTFELQVRTLFMHAWAEPQHDLGYKTAAEMPRDIRREWAWAAASAWGADQALRRVLEWHRMAVARNQNGRAPGEGK
jgi:putative GTP pyrophosphokinase